MEKRIGDVVSEPYRKGTGGRYAEAARTAMLAGGALMLLGGRSRAGAVAAGALLAAGLWCTRFAVYHAGRHRWSIPLTPRFRGVPAQRSEDNPPSAGKEARLAEGFLRFAKSELFPSF
jgi:hypothetical protein